MTADARHAPHAVDTVVKVGGALLDSPSAFQWALDALDRLPRDGRVLVVPGGGPFADTVRAVDRQLGLDDDASHWAAILGMDQYAHVLADRLACATVVDRPEQATPGLLPILAPFRWLRDVDPLPHSWDVTSDSIAAWVAHTIGARRLVLLKFGAGTDRYFPTIAPPDGPLVVEHVLAGTPIPGYR